MADTSPRTQLHTELTMVVTALWHDIDHHDGCGAAAFFTPDASLTFSRRTFQGRAAIDEVYRERRARGPRVSRHTVTNLHIVQDGPDYIDAVSALVLYAQDGAPPIPTTTPVLIADVHDRFVRADPTGPSGPWLIAARRLENQFLAPGDVLAVPTT